jgi:hypothetical protein
MITTLFYVGKIAILVFIEDFLLELLGNKLEIGNCFDILP